MKRINFKPIILFSILFLSTISMYAQPMPPTNPNGNPVPVGNLAALLIFAFGILGAKKLGIKKGKTE